MGSLTKDFTMKTCLALSFLMLVLTADIKCAPKISTDTTTVNPVDGLSLENLPKAYTIESDGLAKDSDKSFALGVYRLTDDIVRGRRVWRNTNTFTWTYLYFTGEQWCVGR